jgi:hypothetical protein
VSKFIVIHILLSLSIFSSRPVFARQPACRTVFTLNKDRIDENLVIPNGERVLQLTANADSSAVVLITDKTQRVYKRIQGKFYLIFDFANGKLNNHPDRFDTYVSWSPDGKKVVVTYVSGGSNAFDLFDLTNAHDGDQTLLIDSEIFGATLNYRPTQVMWSADSSQLAILNERRLSRAIRAKLFSLAGDPLGSIIASAIQIKEALNRTQINSSAITNLENVINEKNQLENPKIIDGLHIPFGEKFLNKVDNPQLTYSLVVTEKSQRVYDLSDGEMIFDFGNRSNMKNSHLSSSQTSWSPDGTKIITTNFEGGSNSYELFDLNIPYRGNIFLHFDNKKFPLNNKDPEAIFWNSKNNLIGIINQLRLSVGEKKYRARILDLDGFLVTTLFGNIEQIKEKLNSL